MARAPLVAVACLLAAACSAEEEVSVPATSAEERRAVAEAREMIPPAEQAAASAAASAPTPAPTAAATPEGLKPQFSTPLPQASAAR